MISDHETNTVFVSHLLPGQHSSVHGLLEKVLGARLRTIPGARDIWCRDYMPIQLAPDRFVQFRYNPDYLIGHPQRRTPDGASLLGLKNCVRSGLVIDGGNVVRWTDAAILTEKVYKDNPGVARPGLRQELQQVLEVDRLVIIPAGPADVCGHADGVLRFVDQDILLVNDYSQTDPSYGAKLEDALKRQGLQAISFPYRPTDSIIDDIPSAEGVYINFLQTNDTILVPAFGLPDDKKAAEILTNLFSHCEVISVLCRDLAAEGGVLNCITWNVLATPALLAARGETG